MGARRGLATAVALLAVGGALTLVVVQATWVHVSSSGAVVSTHSLDAVVVNLDVKGGDAVPVLVPIALFGLAGIVGLVATRGWLRRVVGVLMMLAGLSTMALSIALLVDPAAVVAGALRRASLDPGLGGAVHVSVAALWPLLAVLGGALVLAGGLLAVVGSRDWPAMGARFEAPTRSSRAGRPVDPWTALDRGQDPTVASTPSAAPAAAPADPEMPE
jgi:uncharacterized membrane protein (TIGR02234 family)